jgi:hypothetical protein
MMEGSNPDRRKKMFFTPKCTHQLQGSTSLLFNGYQQLGHDVNHSPLSSVRLRMSGDTFLLPLYTFMVWTETTLYLNEES